MVGRATTGAIVDGGDSGGVDILANSAGAIVTIEAATGVGSAAGNGSDAAIETHISTLALSNAPPGQVGTDGVDKWQANEPTATCGALRVTRAGGRRAATSR